MKKLTKFAVETMMDLLIHTNGQTTTLEVKNNLRELGFFAEQAEVRKLVETVFDDSEFDEKYERQGVNSTYNVYKFSDEFLGDNDHFTPAEEKDPAPQRGIVIITASTPDPVKTTAPIKPATSANAFTQKQASVTAPSMNVNAPATPVAKASTPSNVREPIYIFYTETHTRKSNTDENNWVVTHAKGNNEIHIYDKSLTSDLVRSRYASELKFKIQDVRARRFKNY